MKNLVRRARRKIALKIDPTLNPFPPSPETLATKAELDAIVAELRPLLKETSEDMPEFVTRLAPWYQRVSLPDGITTCSNPKLTVYQDWGNDSLVGGRLTSEEAAVLRPLPKWYFMKSRLPNIEGEEVLEIGSSCGFFSLEFAKIGASRVTGVDFNPKNIERATTLCEILGYDNVNFYQHDLNHGPPLERHDIVFTSSVITHVQFPFQGIYELLRAARKFVIFDEFVLWSEQPVTYYKFLTESKFSKHHSFAMSDRLLLDYFVRCGVDLEAIVKYPYLQDRCLYIIDVSGSLIRPVAA